MADPARLATVYASDEDIAVRAVGDYATLCPESSMLAAGTDGVTTGDDRWTLTSATVPFAANGVAVGHVVRLAGPQPPYKGGGWHLAVSSVAANAVTMRRIGLASNAGHPPGQIGGLTGITFEVKTFAAQIEQVSYDLNQQYGIDPASAFSAPTALGDLRQLRQATVLTVMVEQYTIANRSYKGDFDLKINRYAEELEKVLDWLRLRWTSADHQDRTGLKFSTRLAR